MTVDPAARRARVRRRRDAGRARRARPRRTGSPCPAGTVSHTGVGGLTLGGGMGWLTPQARPDDRQPGVGPGRARRRALRARESPTEHADLFWALRGGGGNFGVVTEFEFRLHEVGPIVQFGLLFCRPGPGGARAAAGARRRRRRCPRRSAPRSSALNAPPAPFVPEEHHFAPGIALILVGFGDAGGARGAVAPLRTALRAAVRVRHADAVRRAAADARRGERLGRPRLREGRSTSTSSPTTPSR